jgi:diaminopimelate epimerase
MIDRPVPFVKMTGSGNDFILVDNRRRLIEPGDAGLWAAGVCRRGLSVGADGAILIEDDPHGETDFAWRFFNSDGSEAEMCGNGGRCAVRFAADVGIAKRPEMTFRTRAGVIRGWALGGGNVRVGLTTPREARLHLTLDSPNGPIDADYLDTGVPHAVVAVADAEAIDVQGLGRALRFHPAFAPRGTNVNFVQALDQQRLIIRTYERGVEGETLACGTGCVAAAILLGLQGRARAPVALRTRGGETLVVDYELRAGKALEPTLQGPVRYAARGELDPEAWA